MYDAAPLKAIRVDRVETIDALKPPARKPAMPRRDGVRLVDRSWTRLVVAIVGCWLAAGCGSSEPSGKLALSTTVPPAQTGPYQVQPGDDLQIKFPPTPRPHDPQAG